MEHCTTYNVALFFCVVVFSRTALKLVVSNLVLPPRVNSHCVAFFIPQIDSLEVLFVKEERRLYRRKRDSLLFLFLAPILVGRLIFRRIERDEPFFTDNQKFSFMQKSFLRGRSTRTDEKKNCTNFCFHAYHHLW